MDPEYLWYRLHGTIENARTSYGGPAIEPQYLRPRWLAPQAFLRLPGTASPSSRAGSVLEALQATCESSAAQIGAHHRHISTSPPLQYAYRSLQC